MTLVSETAKEARKMTISRWVRFTLLGILVLTAVGCERSAPRGQAGAGGPAPQFSATDLDGNTISLEQYKGKVLVINYFTTWCPPCKAEIPDFIAAYREHKEQGLEFIGVDVGEEPDDVNDFVEQQHINYPVIAGDKAMEEKFGHVRSYPTTVVIDRDGNIAEKRIGMLTAEELDKIIAPLLAAESP